MRDPHIGTIIIIFFLPMDYFGLKLMDWWSMEDTELVSYESDPLACLLYQYWRRWRKNKNDLKIQVKLSLLLMENERTFCRIKGICPLGLVKQLVWKLASGRKWRGELTKEAGSDESNKLMRELSCSNAHKEVTVPFMGLPILSGCQRCSWSPSSTCCHRQETGQKEKPKPH